MTAVVGATSPTLGRYWTAAAVTVTRPARSAQPVETPLAQAVALYRDDFLTGFTLADSAEFDEWQTLQTEPPAPPLR